MGDQFGKANLENIGLNIIDFGNVLIYLGSLYITKVDQVQNPRMFLKPH
jgi:hypothetical protein